MITLQRSKKGIPIVGGLVTLLVAANAGALPVWLPSVLGRGNKSYKVKRIEILDVSAGGTLVHFGTGAPGAVVDAFIPIRTVANMNVVEEWDDEKAPELIGQLMAYADAIQVTIQVTAEEIG